MQYYGHRNNSIIWTALFAIIGGTNFANCPTDLSLLLIDYIGHPTVLNTSNSKPHEMVGAAQIETYFGN